MWFLPDTYNNLVTYKTHSLPVLIEEEEKEETLLSHHGEMYVLPQQAGEKNRQSHCKNVKPC